MYHLIPYFIHNQFKVNIFRGEFQACSMFMDLSGFTPMTEAMMEHGKQGGEVLSNILATIFHPMITVVYQRGGFITGFAGDAFTAVFPSDTLPEKIIDPALYMPVVEAARDIQQILREIGCQTTPLGEFYVRAKIGLAYGQVRWGIIGLENHRTFYFRGFTIDSCAAAERHAKTGQIVLHDSLARQLPEGRVDFTPVDDHFFLLQDTLSKPLSLVPIIPEPLDMAVASRFYSRELFNAGQSGEFRDVTCVFISFDDMESDTELDRFISGVLDLTDRFEGHFNRVDFGDKGGNIPVFFGAPKSHENDPDRAMRFVLTLKSEWGNRVPFRAGINSGRVYAGMIGIPFRCEYATLGRVVIIAARLMMKAKWGEILVPEVVAGNSGFNFKLKGDIFCKGIDKAIIAYELISKKLVVDQLFTGKLVGRVKELSRLEDLVKPLAQSTFGGVVYVEGMAGAGKSRLVNELRLKLERDRSIGEIKWFYLPCEEILRKRFNPVLSFLRDYFNYSEENPEENNKWEFESRLNQLIGLTKKEDIRQELIRTKSILGSLLNLRWEHSLFENLDSKERYHNTLYALKNLIKAESLIQPVIIQLEDGHWIDDDSLNWLKILTRNVDGFPFLVLSSCRYRDDGSSFEFKLQGVLEQHVECDYLDRSGSRVLAESLFSPAGAISGAMPETTAQFIFEKSDGNPFFIEQICLYLKENDLLDDTLSLIADSMDIPTSINAVIIARIDRLTSEMKQVVKTASVLGREFAVKILAKMLRNLPVDRYLLEGERETIWTALAGLRYLFRHALIREAVYEMQLKKHLQELHKLAATTIEATYLENLEPYYFDLVEHYERSGNEDKVLEYLEKSGDYANKTYQNRKALDAYSKLIDVLPDTDLKKIQVLLNRGKIHDLIGQIVDSQKDYECALNLSQNLSDRRGEASALNQIGVLYMDKGRYLDALNKFQQALEIFVEIGDRAYEANAILNIGNIYRQQGDYGEAIKYYQQTLKLNKEIKNHLGKANATLSIGLIKFLQGSHSEAMKWYQQALNLYQKTGNRKEAAIAILNIGTVHSAQHRQKETMNCYEMALEIKREIGDRSGCAYALLNMGIHHAISKNFSEARVSLQEALEIFREIEDRSGYAFSCNSIGNIYSEQGRDDEAKDMYQEGYEIASAMDNQRLKAHSLACIGNVYYKKSNLNEAIKCNLQSLKIFKLIGDFVGELNIIRNCGKLYYEMGRYEEALEYYHQAAKMYQKLNERSLENYVIFRTGRILHDMGRLSDAIECCQSAVSVFRELGDRSGEALSLYLLGCVNFGERRYKIAESIFNQVATIYEEMSIRNKMVLSRSMQARVLFHMHRYKKAYTLSLECIKSLNELDPDRSDLEFGSDQILFTHYLILQHRKAPDSIACLEQAYTILRRTTDKIPEMDGRMNVLNATLNQPIVKAWEKCPNNQ